jgi:hypothetical protein
MAVSFQKLSEAFLFVDVDGAGNAAYVCRETGEIYWESSLIDTDEEPLPDDIEDGEKYLTVPNRRDLDLGKPLALAFARQFLPENYDDVRDIFDRRGAYRKFHSLLRHRNAMDRWYKFEAEATDQALRDWCEVNGLELVD